MATLYTLDSIVREFINETDNDSLKGYDRYFALAVAGLRNLNKDISGVKAIANLEVNENTLTAPLPNNYINYVGLYLCIDERLFPLGLNNAICLNRNYTDCGEPEDYPNFVTNSTAYDLGWGMGYNTNSDIKIRNGQNLGGYYGVAGGNNYWGYYKIDTEKGLIQFSNLRSYNVVLEYIADISQIGGKYFVVPQIREALKAWISWKDVANKKGTAISQIDYRKMEYFREKRNAQRALRPIRLDEALQTIRSTFKQSPKY
jgi:hypothetical protein